MGNDVTTYIKIPFLQLVLSETTILTYSYHQNTINRCFSKCSFGAASECFKVCFAMLMARNLQDGIAFSITLAFLTSTRSKCLGLPRGLGQPEQILSSGHWIKKPPGTRKTNIDLSNVPCGHRLDLRGGRRYHAQFWLSRCPM